MGEVVFLPGVERLPDRPPVDGPRLLRFAADLGVDEVVIVGRSRDGSRYVAASIDDVEKIIGILMDGIAVWQSNAGAEPVFIEPGDPE